MINCENCNHENEDNSKFCSYCGLGLVKECPLCLNQFQKYANYCNTCGETLTLISRKRIKKESTVDDDLEIIILDNDEDSICKKRKIKEEPIEKQQQVVFNANIDLDNRRLIASSTPNRGDKKIKQHKKLTNKKCKSLNKIISQLIDNNSSSSSISGSSGANSQESKENDNYVKKNNNNLEKLIIKREKFTFDENIKQSLSSVSSPLITQNINITNNKQQEFSQPKITQFVNTKLNKSINNNNKSFFLNQTMPNLSTLNLNSSLALPLPPLPPQAEAQLEPQTASIQKNFNSFDEIIDYVIAKYTSQSPVIQPQEEEKVPCTSSQPVSPVSLRKSSSSSSLIATKVEKESNEVENLNFHIATDDSTIYPSFLEQAQQVVDLSVDEIIVISSPEHKRKFKIDNNNNSRKRQEKNGELKFQSDLHRQLYEKIDSDYKDFDFSELYDKSLNKKCELVSFLTNKLSKHDVKLDQFFYYTFCKINLKYLFYNKYHKNKFTSDLSKTQQEHWKKLFYIFKNFNKLIKKYETLMKEELVIKADANEKASDECC